MLIRRILLCQRRAFNLWEFVPAEHQMLQRPYGMKHKNTWKALFKASKVPPPTSEDHGLHAAWPPAEVNSPDSVFPNIFMREPQVIVLICSGLRGDSGAE